MPHFTSKNLFSLTMSVLMQAPCFLLVPLSVPIVLYVFLVRACVGPGPMSCLGPKTVPIALYVFLGSVCVKPDPVPHVSPSDYPSCSFFLIMYFFNLSLCPLFSLLTVPIALYVFLISTWIDPDTVPPVGPADSSICCAQVCHQPVVPEGRLSSHRSGGRAAPGPYCHWPPGLIALASQKVRTTDDIFLTLAWHWIDNGVH